MSIIIITHDLGIVADMADEIIIMYAGEIVERGTARDIFIINSIRIHGHFCNLSQGLIVKIKVF